jgi:dTDP-4-amino-4,6-dideoxygalactose transaminase
MIKKIPISAAALPLPVLLASLRCLGGGDYFLKTLAKDFAASINKKHIVFLNSGLAGLYQILELLKQGSSKKEVVLPAYTAGSLVVAVKKAGLTPVLCDISPEDFNMDPGFLPKVVSDNTLGIVGVHLFGIVMKGLETLKKDFPGTAIIEDACQAMGSMAGGRPVGGAGTLSFFSFNKGKNLPTFGGGCVAVDDENMYAQLNDALRRLPRPGLLSQVEEILKLFLLSWAMTPWVYGAFYPLIARYKETVPPASVMCSQYSELQASIAVALLRRRELWSAQRYRNGMEIIAGLKQAPQIMVPQISSDTCPAFNRLPVVFRDIKKRDRVEKKLWQAGIETSRMYLKPLHHMFDLGYTWGNFPNAVYLAGHLLTLPTHPLLRKADVGAMISIIREDG